MERGLLKDKNIVVLKNGRKIKLNNTRLIKKYPKDFNYKLEEKIIYYICSSDIPFVKIDNNVLSYDESLNHIPKKIELDFTPEEIYETVKNSKRIIGLVGDIDYFDINNDIYRNHDKTKLIIGLDYGDNVFCHVSYSRDDIYSYTFLPVLKWEHKLEKITSLSELDTILFSYKYCFILYQKYFVCANSLKEDSEIKIYEVGFGKEYFNNQKEYFKEEYDNIGIIDLKINKKQYSKEYIDELKQYVANNEVEIDDKIIDCYNNSIVYRRDFLANEEIIKNFKEDYFKNENNTELKTIISLRNNFPVKCSKEIVITELYHLKFLSRNEFEFYKYKILQFGLKQDADVAYEIYSVLHRAALICHKLHYPDSPICQWQFEIDNKAYMYWLEISAILGNIDGRYEYTWFSRNKLGFEYVRNELEDLANNYKYPEAASRLSFIYQAHQFFNEKNILDKPDLEKSLYWAKRAYELGLKDGEDDVKYRIMDIYKDNNEAQKVLEEYLKSVKKPQEYVDKVYDFKEKKDINIRILQSIKKVFTSKLKHSLLSEEEIKEAVELIDDIFQDYKYKDSWLKANPDEDELKDNQAEAEINFIKQIMQYISLISLEELNLSKLTCYILYLENIKFNDGFINKFGKLNEKIETFDDALAVVSNLFLFSGLFTKKDCFDDNVKLISGNNKTIVGFEEIKNYLYEISGRQRFRKVYINTMKCKSINDNNSFSKDEKFILLKYSYGPRNAVKIKLNSNNQITELKIIKFIANKNYKIILNEKRESFIKLLSNLPIDKDTILNITQKLKTEPQMKEFEEYLTNNPNANQSEILEKALQIYNNAK